jgi:hypothetical protein
MTVESMLRIEMEEAERQAWKALSRYKFVMFGYWCGVWVHLHRVLNPTVKEPNPWKELVKTAKTEVTERGWY